jgi:transcriptional regulator with XRE-family HTH domain
MTQQDVATQAGVERSWLVRLESGKENPTLAKLLAVTSTVGLNLELVDAEVAAGRPQTSLPTPVNLDDVLSRFDERP